jgi:subtilisin family serine protease
MMPVDLVKLTALMERTSGRREIVVGLIDGPVATNHPDLASDQIREIPGRLAGVCAQPPSAACLHGTAVAGILCARRGSAAPAICPGCTLLLRPIFLEATLGNQEIPSTTPEELAAAIVECVDAGAHVVNMSVALASPSAKREPRLEEALDYAATRGVIAVAAAGNQGTLGSSPITRHPWVIPVVACDLRGRPMSQSNLGSSTGRRGLSAPGSEITSLGADGQARTFGGTSAATPFVTGAIALVWSEFPTASAVEVKWAVTRAHAPRRNLVVPPLLDAWAAYQAMVMVHASGKEMR